MLEEIVETRCGALLVVVTDGYFRSKNCLRELGAALHAGKPLILVHEVDPAHGGLPLEELRSQCPLNLEYRPTGQDQLVQLAVRERVSSQQVVQWQRIELFQLVSLRLIGEALLESSLYIAGDLSEQPYSLPRTVYVSPHNRGSEALLQELVDEAREAAGRGADRATADCFLLLLNGSVFEDAQLVQEVEAAMDAGQQIVMVHDASVQFADIMRRTPQQLGARPPDGRGLYNQIAVALLQGPHRPASLRIIASKLNSEAQVPRVRVSAALLEGGRLAGEFFNRSTRLVARLRTWRRRRIADVIAPEAGSSINADPLLARSPTP